MTAGFDKNVYWVWADMVGRCTNASHKAFHNYGGRGITVSQQWRDAKQFMADMGPRPAGHTLERRDNDQGYSRENCYWADRQTQNLNKRIYRNNKTGVRGLEVRSDGGYRVRLRRGGRVAFDLTFHDFFEACCAAISMRAQLAPSKEAA